MGPTCLRFFRRCVMSHLFTVRMLVIYLFTSQAIALASVM